jgi:hypothetical protein
MILKNESNRMRIYTLPHEDVCVDKCFCTSSQHAQSVHDPKTGIKSVRMVSLLVPVSVHIPAQGESADLPECSKVASIAADLKSRVLTVKKGS